MTVVLTILGFLITAAMAFALGARANQLEIAAKMAVEADKNKRRAEMAKVKVENDFKKIDSDFIDAGDRLMAKLRLLQDAIGAGSMPDAGSNEKDREND